MPIVDIIVIVAVVLFVLSGLRYGFIHTFGNLIGMIIGFAISTLALFWVQNVIDLSTKPWLTLFVFLLISLVVSGLVGFLVGLIDEMYKIISFIPLLKPINKLLGGLTGLIEALIAITAFIIFADFYLKEGTIRSAIDGSKILVFFSKPAGALTQWVVNIASSFWQNN